MIGYKLSVYPTVPRFPGDTTQVYCVTRLSDDTTMLYTESRHYALVVVVELNKLYAQSAGQEAWIDYVVSGTPL